MQKVNIPNSGTFNVILVEKNKKHFIFGDTLPYHPDIFEKFTQLNPGDFGICCGGKMEIKNGSIKVYGKSNVYGPFDKKIVRDLMEKYCKDK